MLNPRDILNEIKWKKNSNLDYVEVYILHRGALDDTKIISGKDIFKIDRSFIHTKSTMITFHRIKKIKYSNEIFFQRKKGS